MANVFSSKREVYIEIAERYEKYITLGVIKAGEKLPSVRTAASELRVNPNTVQRAYSLLEEKRADTFDAKKGAFVIYDNERKEISEVFDILTPALLKLKEEGFSKDRIISVIEEVYKND